VELPESFISNGEVFAMAWSDQYAGYLDWSAVNASSIERGEYPPLRIQVDRRSGTVTTASVNRRGEAVVGARLVCLPSWNDWGFLGPRSSSQAVECPEFLDALGLIGVSDEAGRCVFSNLPRLDPENTVFFVVAVGPDYVSNGMFVEGWPDEPYIADVKVERLADLFLGGTIRSTAGRTIASGSVSVNGKEVCSVEPDGSWRINGDELGPPTWTFTFAAPGFENASFRNWRPAFLLNDQVRQWDVELAHL
jgi:hypothetical protein